MQKIVWEVVDNEGETVWIGLRQMDMFKAQLGMPDGTRVCKYRGASMDTMRLVGEFERKNGRIVSI